MPKLGLTMLAGTVTQWLKREGDAVAKGEPLLEIESEKVSFTVEAPADGLLRRILVPDGEEVPVATTVGYIGAADEALPDTAAPSDSGPAVASVAERAPSAAAVRPAASTAAPPPGGYPVSPAARKLAKDLGVDLAQVRPAKGSRITTEDVEAYHQTPQPAAASEARGGDRPASPAARKLAKELGIDVARVPSKLARVTTDDVQAYAESMKSGSAASAGGQSVSFYSDGVRLAGVLFLPPDQQAGERRPGVVLCTGIQGLKELGPRDLAVQLAQQGFVALIFDYRGFGQSEGTRWHPLPHEQVRDTRAALTFLATQSQVDAQRLGALGISFGGGHVLSAAAIDERIKAVVAIEPVTNARRWLRSLRAEWEWRAFLDRIEQDRAARVSSGASQVVPLYDVMAPDPETKVVLEALAKMRPELELQPQFPLESAEAFLEYEPDEAVAEIAPRAVLFLHGELDMLVSPDESRNAALWAGDSSRLVILPNMGHLNWQRPGHPVFAQIVELASGWFREHLEE